MRRSGPRKIHALQVLQQVRGRIRSPLHVAQYLCRKGQLQIFFPHHGLHQDNAHRPSGRPGRLDSRHLLRERCNETTSVRLVLGGDADTGRGNNGLFSAAGPGGVVANRPAVAPAPEAAARGNIDVPIRGAGEPNKTGKNPENERAERPAENRNCQREGGGRYLQGGEVGTRRLLARAIRYGLHRSAHARRGKQQQQQWFLQRHHQRKRKR
mmetsp:Transcript_17752/g.36522  ORF Transcript_17752/g.36522 Transcript_17752/m.36522 type:complete len:211 (-) Transcript_17752:244-876(-)